MVHVVLYIPVLRYATSFVHGTVSKDSEFVWMRPSIRDCHKNPFKLSKASRDAHAPLDLAVAVGPAGPGAKRVYPMLL